MSFFKVMSLFPALLWLSITGFIVVFYLIGPIEYLGLYPVIIGALSPLAVYPLLVGYMKVKPYMVHAFYIILLQVPAYIAESMLDTTAEDFDECAHTLPEELVMAQFFVFPFMLTVRWMVGRYKPLWVGETSPHPAGKYLIASFVMIVPALLVFGAIGGMAHGCSG